MSEQVAIINQEWLKAWINFSKCNNLNEQSHLYPGEIDNSNLLCEENYCSPNPNDIYNNQIKAECLDFHDYAVIPVELWESFKSCYKGGVSIIRELNIQTQLHEFKFPYIQLSILQFSPTNQFSITALKPMFYSKYFNIPAIKQRILVIADKEIINDCTKPDISLWKIHSVEQLNEFYDNLNSNNLTKESQIPGERINDTNAKDLSGAIILAKVVSNLPKPAIVSISDPTKCHYCQGEKVFTYICFQCSEIIVYCSLSCKTKDLKFHNDKCKPNETVVDLSKHRQAGLKNLGNTCYMNSGLQCLSNTIQLTSRIINNENIDKQFSSCYTYLIKRLWLEQKGFIIPDKFKKALDTRSKLFEGTNQYDSQEFVSTVLDLLHEDLKQVKPSDINEIDESIKSIEKGSNKSWRSFSDNNNSIIKEIFYGQFASTIKCPNCQACSYQFDPFNILSVPIPIDDSFEMTFIFQKFMIISQPTFHTITCKKSYTIDIFRTEVSKLLDISKQSFFVCLLNKSTLYIDKLVNINENVKPLFKSSIKLNEYICLLEINPLALNSESYIGLNKKKSLASINKESPKKDHHYKDDNNESLFDYNNGFKSDYVKILTQVRYYNCEPSPINHIGANISRYIYISMDSSLKELYSCVFAYLKPLFVTFIKNNQEYLGLSVEEFNTIENQKCLNMLKSLLFLPKYKQYLPSKFPFCVFFDIKISPHCERYKIIDGQLSQCKYCRKIRNECGWCSVPFDDNTTVKQYMNNGGSENNDVYINNNNRYKDDNYRKNTDFEIVVCINQTLLQNLLQQSICPLLTPQQMAAIPVQKKSIDLTKCINMLFQDEKLDKWSCEKCKVSVTAIKSLSISKMPQILIIHLKRFQNSEHGELTKITKNVDYKLSSDFSDQSLVKGFYNYKMYGIIYHYGTLNGGHYSACCYNVVSNKWFRYDDTLVIEVSEDRILCDNAYLLFYSRVILDDNNNTHESVIKDYVSICNNKKEKAVKEKDKRTGVINKYR